MRSVDSPRVLHDATVELEDGGRVRSVNLSTGGILISDEKPREKGDKVALKVNLRDGGNPLSATAEVVRAGTDGIALRFVDLDDMAKQRIQRLVQKREPTGIGKRDVRIHLPSLGAPLRASARELNDAGVMIEADLPWLRLGSPVTAELSPDRACDGHVSWIGLDVTRVGAARLRIFVDFSGDENALTPPPPELIKKTNAAKLEAHGLAARRHLVWPALAVVSLLAVAALTTVLSLRPPRVVLLPSSASEREPVVVKIPAQTIVPKEDAPPVMSDDQQPAMIAMPFGPPLVNPNAVTTTAKEPEPTAVASRTPAKAVKSKHGRAKHR